MGVVSVVYVVWMKQVWDVSEYGSAFVIRWKERGPLGTASHVTVCLRVERSPLCCYKAARANACRTGCEPLPQRAERPRFNRVAPPGIRNKSFILKISGVYHYAMFC